MASVTPENKVVTKMMTSQCVMTICNSLSAVHRPTKKSKKAVLDLVPILFGKINTRIGETKQENANGIRWKTITGEFGTCTKCKI
eukprot:10956459-Ditylum_brightwellii.AAC.1